MNTTKVLVLTLIGPDRPGLVEAVSETVARHGGNWLESRMARLAGQFAGILRVSVPEGKASVLEADLGGMDTHGLRILVQGSVESPPDVPSRLLDLELVGQDRPGIVREISQALAGRGVNVEELVTDCVSAPMSGEQLFRAHARLRAPRELAIADLTTALEAVAHDLMVDVALGEAHSDD
ncbi:MAG: glycine cleavage system protein R [Polyangiaceae bacterium]|nr:glycine cleavage system protein R [Polyangiaceae bacterium]